MLRLYAFLERLRGQVHADPREQSGARPLNRRVSWEQIVGAVEAVKGEAWATFRDRHGDWGRDVALWLGRRLGRLTLRELAQRAGGVDYTTAGVAFSRIARRLTREPRVRRFVERVQRELSNVEM